MTRNAEALGIIVVAFVVGVFAAAAFGSWAVPVIVVLGIPAVAWSLRRDGRD